MKKIFGVFVIVLLVMGCASHKVSAKSVDFEVKNVNIDTRFDGNGTTATDLRFVDCKRIGFSGGIPKKLPPKRFVYEIRPDEIMSPVEIILEDSDGIRYKYECTLKTSKGEEAGQ